MPYMLRCLTVLILLASCLLAACENAEIARVRDARDAEQTGAEVTAPDAAEGDFDATITFCRKISRKSKRPIGVGEQFTIAESSAVYGVVDFENLAPETNHTVHLIWVRPDGREYLRSFRRFADIMVIPAAVEDEGSDAETAFTARIQWKKAEDLHYLKESSRSMTGPDCTLSRKLDISAKKNREPGVYRLQVYLDRKFLLEKSFEILLPETS